MQLLLASLAIAASVTTQQIPSDELELLAHLINAEAGATYCSDEMRYMVGAVALNRVASEDFPDTLEEVIYQDGQYACVTDGNFEKEPTDACYEIAVDLLMNWVDIPGNVVFQAEFTQGDGVYKQVDNMYFCYIEREEKNMDYQKMWFTLKKHMIAHEEDARDSNTISYYISAKDVVNEMAKIEVTACEERETRMKEIDMTLAKMLEREE